MAPGWQWQWHYSRDAVDAWFAAAGSCCSRDGIRVTLSLGSLRKWRGMWRRSGVDLECGAVSRRDSNSTHAGRQILNMCRVSRRAPCRVLYSSTVCESTYPALLVHVCFTVKIIVWSGSNVDKCLSNGVGQLRDRSAIYAQTNFATCTVNLCSTYTESTMAYYVPTSILWSVNLTRWGGRMWSMTQCDRSLPGMILKSMCALRYTFDIE